MLYLKGYSEGFDSAQKLLWHQANQLLIRVNNDSKDFVREFIVFILKNEKIGGKNFDSGNKR